MGQILIPTFLKIKIVQYKDDGRIQQPRYTIPSLLNVGALQAVSYYCNVLILHWAQCLLKVSRWNCSGENIKMETGLEWNTKWRLAPLQYYLIQSCMVLT